MEELIQKRFEESTKLASAFAKANAPAIALASEIIVESLNTGGKILFFGNGGSAADAQHLASEFVNRFIIERPPLPALALTTDTSLITSISNDYSFSEVFTKQIKALGNEGDVAFGISTSGNSPNVVLGLKVAKAKGLKTIALTGSGGGEIAAVAEVVIMVDSRKVPRIQEVHIICGHIICELVDIQLFQGGSK